MPTLRWFGRSWVTSWSLMRIAAGRRRLEAGDHAQGRGLAAAAGAEEGDEFAALDREIECSHHGLRAEGLAKIFDLEKCHAFALPCAPSASGAAPCALRPKSLDQAHAGPGDDEGDDRQRRRLIGAVGADQLQIGAEGRAVQQARHGELADDDGEGQECAAQHRDAHIGEDHAEQDRRPAGAQALRRLRQGPHIDGPHARIDRAIHVGQRQRHIAEGQQQIGRARRCRSSAARTSCCRSADSRTRDDRRDHQRQQGDELDDRRAAAAAAAGSNRPSARPAARRR